MRERMVTRTVVTREVHFKMFNTETMTLEDKVLKFGVDTVIANNTDGLATLNKRLVRDGIKGTACMIDKVVDDTKLYGMSEVEFLKYARELPPRANNEN